MKAVILSALFLAVGALASPGTYEGSGKARVVNGSLSTYTSTVVVKEITPKQEYQIDESWVTEKGEKGSSSLTFHFNADGTLKVRNKGVDVGCGYSFEDANGMWLDYKIQTPEGPMHVNLYHSKIDDKVLRLGDAIFRGQAMFWTDALIKK